MIIIIFFFSIWYLSLFTQTFFHHRYSAHGMFTMSKGAEKVFYVLSWLFQGSSFISPYYYGILHRLHHAHADTDKDPHSPIYSKNIFQMMWKTKTVYASFKDKNNVDPKFAKNLPWWGFMEWLGDTWGSRIFFVGLYTTFFYFYANHWYLWLLLPVVILMSPVHGAIINWFAHKFGYVSQEVNDTSKNLLPLDVLMLGESYHNNHHKFGGRANFGHAWHEIDPVYQVIKVLSFFHVIKLKANNDLNYMPT
jgi:stearoyl-CoA desaturase (delta-9 desaturase)